MRYLSVLSVVCSLTVAGVTYSATAGHPVVKSNTSSMPMAFTENQGQWDDRVRFRVDAGGATLWLTTDGACHQFTRRVGNDMDLDNSPGFQKWSEHGSEQYECMTIKTSFVGANPNPRTGGQNRLEYKCNFFLGSNPDEWYPDVPNYQNVVYKDIYSGIDLKYYSSGTHMEYDFIVAPGADVRQIVIRYEGIRSLSVNDAGELVVMTDWGKIVERRPVVYQMIGEDRVLLQGQYSLHSSESYGFILPDGYDPERTLYLDPVIVYSSYLGAGDDDWGRAVVADAAGCAYVTGRTLSADFPTENPYQTYQGNYDVYVSKLSNNGSSLVYSTYVGGTGSDKAWCLTLDEAGCVYVTGGTKSTDFPTQNPYQTDQGGDDVFVTKLNSDGNALLYSTYLGGAGEDSGWGIAVDETGCAYITGETRSTDFPTENPYQTYQGDYDAFVTKFASNGSLLEYSTYLCGVGFDWASDIAVDAAGCAYVIGTTYSSDFPTENPYQTYQGVSDFFVTKLNADGSSLSYSTYLGGAVYDDGLGIVVDEVGCAYVTGITQSSDFPSENPYQTYQGSNDAIVTKLSSDGASLVYSTHLGGTDSDVSESIALDNDGRAHITGYTSSSDFPTENPYQGDQGGMDAFVAELSADGSALLYGTYLGGQSIDQGHSIAVDNIGCTYVTGYTYSSDFATESPYQEDQVGLDGFLVRFCHGCCGIYTGGLTGNTNCSDDGKLTLSDVSRLIDHLYISKIGLCCYASGNTNGSWDDGDCKITLSDVSRLIDALYISKQPTADCMPECER